MRAPTVKQFELLKVLGRGGVAVAPKRAEWMPLLRHGWVERYGEGPTPRGGFLPPLRITAAGYRALAVGLERHGWPDVSA